MIGRRQAAAAPPVPVPPAAPVVALVPVEVVAQQLVDEGMWDRRPVEDFRLAVAQLEQQARDAGLEVVPGWAGRPSLSQAGADTLAARARAAVAADRARQDAAVADDADELVYKRTHGIVSPAEKLAVFGQPGFLHLGEIDPYGDKLPRVTSPAEMQATLEAGPVPGWRTGWPSARPRRNRRRGWAGSPGSGPTTPT